MNEDRLGVAEIKCREFLKKNPSHTYAMSQLAEIASRLGHYNDAEFLLEKATTFEPDNAHLRMKYLMVLRKTQKFAKTTKQVNILCEKFPDNLMYQSQKATKERTILEKKLHLKPNMLGINNSTQRLM